MVYSNLDMMPCLKNRFGKSQNSYLPDFNLLKMFWVLKG